MISIFSSSRNPGPGEGSNRKLSCLLLLLGVLASASFAVGGTKSATLSWDPNQESDLAGYRVYYGDKARKYQSDEYVGNTTSHRIDGLEAGKRYYFVVSALDHAGNESGFSNEVSIVTPADDGGDDQEPETGSEATLGRLAYNFPNPFRINQEVTAIRYELDAAGEVTIQILDASTNLVKTLAKNALKRAGEHTEDRWDGRNRHGDFVANGVYYCSIRVNNEQKMIKIALTR